MKTRSFFLINLLALVALVSCDPVAIDGELPDGSTKLCINSYFTADDTWLVNITRGKYILDDTHDMEFFGINNATVSISENGNLLTTLSHVKKPYLTYGRSDDGWYESTTSLPQAGKTYQVNVSALGFGNISAECLVPHPVLIFKVDTLSTIPDEQNRVPLDVYFYDREGTSDYYEMNVRVTWKITSPHENRISSAEIPLTTLDPLFYYSPESYDPLDADTKSLPVLFSDAGLNGKLIKVRCKAHYYGENPTPGIEIEQSYEIALRTLSREYYEYKTTALLQQDSKTDPFAQPVRVYSNVQNGFGIFAGASANRFPIGL